MLYSMSADRSVHQYNVLIAGTVIEILSLSLNIFILLATCWIRSIPAARHHVQRVSYKIILWALAAQSTYNAVRLVLYTGDSQRAFFASSPRMCTAGIYFFFKELHVTNFLITCIALNLMLIVCFGVNPIEQKLLRWYIGGSIALGSFIPMIPAALGHFGADPIYKLCYLTPFEVDQRMRVVVLDVVLWALLSCVIASIAIIAVLITLFKQGRNTAQALLRGNPINADLNSSDNTNRPACLFSWRSWGGRRSCSGSGDDSDNNDPKGSQPSESHHHHLQDKFLGIALKISLYPIFLIVANVVLSVADIYFNITLRDGMESTMQIGFLAVYQLLYAGRGLCFAILCITIDPSFQAGIAAAWYAKRNSKMAIHGQPPIGLFTADNTILNDKISFGQFLGSIHDQSPITPTFPIPPTDPKQQLPIFLNPKARTYSHQLTDLDLFKPIDPNDNSPEAEIDVELSSALTVLPYAVPHILPPLLTPPAEEEIDPIDYNNNIAPPNTTSPISARPRSSTPLSIPLPCTRRFTRVFTGVTSDSLPQVLTDGVDVDLRLSYESPTRFARPRDIAAMQGMRQLDAVALSDMIDDESKEYGLEGRGQAFTEEEEGGRRVSLGDVGTGDIDRIRRDEGLRDSVPRLSFDIKEPALSTSLPSGSGSWPRRSMGERGRVDTGLDDMGAEKRFEELNAML